MRLLLSSLIKTALPFNAIKGVARMLFNAIKLGAPKKANGQRLTANSQKEIDEFARLFLEYKEDRQDKADEAREVIPAESLVLHYQLHDNGKDCERNNLLNNLQLPNGEWAAILHTAQAVGRYHKAVFEECHQPTDEDNDD